MRADSWVKLVVKSAVGAFIIAAAELGVAFALRVIDWAAVPVSETMLGRTAVWVVFIFTTAVLGGVAVARHGVRAVRAAIAHRRALAAVARANVRGPVKVARVVALDAARGTAAVLARVGAALAAALGAATAFALVWIPMDYVGLPGQQVRAITLAAAAGLALGTVMALSALYTAPIAAAAAATAAWVWLFGLASLWLANARAGANPAPPRLAMLDAPHFIGADEWWLGPNLMVAIAAVFGTAVAVTARWVGSRTFTVAVAGAAGPLMVATAYVVVGPLPDLAPAYVASLLAVAVGLVASVLTAAVRRRPASAPEATPAITAAPAPSAALLAGQPVRAALPAHPAAAHPAAALPAVAQPAAAMAAIGPAGPSRVTLEAEYAARQPDRGAPPVFEVTTMPAKPKPATRKPGKPMPATAMPATPMPATAGPAARPVSPAGAQPRRIPDPVPAPVVMPAAAAASRETAPEPAMARAEYAPSGEPPRGRGRAKSGRAKKGQAKSAPSANVQATTNGQATNGHATNGHATTGQATSGPGKNARVEKQRGRSTRQSRQERREREHVDWVKNLVNLPNDPSLDLRSRP